MGETPPKVTMTGQQPYEQLSLEVGTVIGEYEVMERIAPDSGQSNIYVVKEMRNRKKFAMKLEKKETEHSTLELELWILVTMKKKTDATHFCKAIVRGSWDTYDFMVLTLCGKSLRNLLKKAPGHKFSMGCAIGVATQCLRALMHLHKVGFIHRDVQPANFAIGTGGQKELRTIYILDFYYVHKYRFADGKLKPKRDNPTKFLGAWRYATKSTHKATELCRADDLEAWVYMLFEMLKGSLPWDGLKTSDEIFKKQKDLRNSDSSKKKYFDGLPRDIEKLYDKVCALDYEDEPEYGEMLDLLDEARKHAKAKEFPYDWESNDWKGKLDEDSAMSKENKSREKAMSKEKIDKSKEPTSKEVTRSTMAEVSVSTNQRRRKEA